eukprot:2046641-Alexandrium_andersonii.AAC.1
MGASASFADARQANRACRVCVFATSDPLNPTCVSADSESARRVAQNAPLGSFENQHRCRSW